MTSRRLPEQPSFADWYRAIHNRDPFPWQNRLANQVTDSRGWPGLVGVPTGLGKTACMDIAVWALASQADTPPAERTTPTRIWWVVNRRLLIDDTYAHASRIASRLAKPESGTVKAIATRLNFIAGSSPHGQPLEAMRLRGGAKRGRPSTPAQPAVLCSTIPMFGSRILFRGYGTSRLMRPIDAALAYTDSLVIIDEAHLATHLQNLLNDLRSLDTAEIPVLPEVRRSPTVVALTATGDPGSGSRFNLDADDLAHPEIKKRIYADKPIRLRAIASATDNMRVNGVVAAVKDLLAKHPPGVTLVFVNTPTVARKTADKLRSTRTPGKPRVVTATGQIRGDEAEQTTKTILAAARSGQNKALERHLVIVSTQTLEVGADIDADYLVTEACGVRALTQRLGRLNRIGVSPHAEGVYIHTPSDKNVTWPVYGDEPSAVLTRLKEHRDGEETVHLPPALITEVLGAPQDTPGRAPVIAPGILQEWIKTSTPPPGEAPVDPYFSGMSEPGRSVSIAWRVHLPREGKDDKIWPRIQENELVDVFVSEAEKFLDSLNEDRCVLLNLDRVTVTPYSKNRQLRPGDTILVRSDAGGLDQDGHFHSDSKAWVPDVSLFNTGVPINKQALLRIYNSELPAVITESVKELEPSDVDYETEPDEKEPCFKLLNGFKSFPPHGIDKTKWSELVQSMLDSLRERVRQGGSALVRPRGEVPRLPVRGDRPLVASISDEHDERSLHDASVSLADHGEDTASWASLICGSLGIADPLSRVVVKAAQMHDAGKSDPRFQRCLDPNGRSISLLAKSNTPTSQWASDRTAAGWPKGGRHEELSRRIVEAWLLTGTHEFLSHETADLLLHLVVSHHGHGRPLVSPVADNSCGTSLKYQIEDTPVSVESDLSVGDWEQPSRFKRLNTIYGRWGLALAETIVRQADHQSSQYGSTREE